MLVPDSFRRLDNMCKMFPDIPRIRNVVNQEVEILYPNTWNPKLFAGVDGECLESGYSTFAHDPDKSTVIYGRVALILRMNGSDRM